jgi:DNA polymerase-3 subunit gamma/tau
VLDRVSKMKRMTWMLLSGSAQVRDLHEGILTVAFTEGARKNFLASGHDEILRQALIDELGVAWKIEAIIDESIGKGSRAGSGRGGRDSGGSRQPSAAATPAPAAPLVDPDTDAPPASSPDQPAAPTAPPDWAVAPAAPAEPAGPADPAGQDPGGVPESKRASEPTDRSATVVAAKGAIRKTRQGSEAAVQDEETPPEIHDDDDVVDDGTVSGQELLARELGAQVIDDQRHDDR